MKKISTLYKVIYKNHKPQITNEIRKENEWVFTEDNVVATRKFDGTACMIKNGELYRRYDAKKGKVIPKGAIPCDIQDPLTGHYPHWIKCEENNPSDKYHFKAFKKDLLDGTYELCGEKIQGNKEKIYGYKLIKHGSERLILPNLNFNGLKKYLSDEKNKIEGIVFYGDNGKMCKLRKSDFGINRK